MALGDDSNSHVSIQRRKLSDIEQSRVCVFCRTNASVHPPQRGHPTTSRRVVPASKLFCIGGVLGHRLKLCCRVAVAVLRGRVLRAYKSWHVSQHRSRRCAVRRLSCSHQGSCCREGREYEIASKDRAARGHIHPTRAYLSGIFFFRQVLGPYDVSIRHSHRTCALDTVIGNVHQT